MSAKIVVEITDSGVTHKVALKPNFCVKSNASKLARRLPNLSKNTIAELCSKYSDIGYNLKKEVSDKIEAQFKLQFGRSMEFTDFRISGVGREEFPVEFKSEIRAKIEIANDADFIASVLRHIISNYTKYAIFSQDLKLEARLKHSRKILNQKGTKVLKKHANERMSGSS